MTVYWFAQEALLPPPWREGFEHVLSSEALPILRFAVGVSRIYPKN